ncbi:inactive rhomboid protein 1-like [Oppia nitens]|uniref:inactive rhomboid protein 1-like n=1 Tax=Oppia nitens TaxID=1686743 RepID=UPI0023DA717C|nr:inactive rhomboid protein 1-like [Oppia nitens]
MSDNNHNNNNSNNNNNNNNSNNSDEHHFRRAHSLDPTMTDNTDNTSAAADRDGKTGGGGGGGHRAASVHVNPLFNVPHNASVRRQVSEPTDLRHRVVRNVSRTESIRDNVIKHTKQFFGIDNNPSNDEIWRQRRQRLLRNFGRVRQPVSEEPIQMSTRMGTIESSGFDEIDGVLATNKLTDIIENRQQLMTEATTTTVPQEDTARRPALKITFKAIAMASNALKNSLSTRADQQTTAATPESDDETLDIRAGGGGGGSQTLTTADSVFYPSAEMVGQIDDDFFYQPTQVPEEEDEEEEHNEVDGRYARSAMQRPIGWHIDRQESIREEKTFQQMLIDKLLNTDNSNRKHFGQGFIDRLLGRRAKEDLTKEERKAVEDHIDDFRPFFTYWITTVQILIMIIALSSYGFGSIGTGFEQINGLVYVKSLSLQQVDYFESRNFWIGPRAADLIHLGAKYTPCMRKDQKIYDIIDDERRAERETGCCIRNDNSGCVQTFKDKCSTLLSTWYKWDGHNSLQRSSGPVCGQDPRYCEQPASIDPYQWSDDITKWPICRKRGSPYSYYEKHMNCELIARPCCLGIYGECHITTREYCNFIKGRFHEEATLCSQVSCMRDVCGMIPFYTDDSPDQFYRIWTPIFLHAGILHLAITVLFQYFIMRKIEKNIGWLRLSIIYFGSGIGGYLASAVFLPWKGEVGPAGSLYGVMACFFIELINMWSYMENPVHVLLKQLLVAGVLLILGFLPWIDNYAHIAGFIIGLLLSAAVMPYIQLSSSKMTPTHRIIQIVGCLLTVLSIIVILFVMLYKYPIYDIKFFKYLNCIPLTGDWCANQDIQKYRSDVL